MLPTKIQPFIVNIVNNSSTTAFPVVILDAYNSLSYYTPNSSSYYTYIITISTSSLPIQLFYFQYFDINNVEGFFTLDGTIVGDSFTYVGANAPTLIAPFPSVPNGFNINGTQISPTSYPNLPLPYQNNANIGISMNPNMNSTYQEFLEATMTNPFAIEKMFFSTNNATQIDDNIAINIFTEDADGSDFQSTIEPFINPYQYSLEGVVIQYDKTIDGFTGIEITSLLPSTSVELYLYPKKRAKQKLSKNKKFIETSKNKLALKQKNLFEKNKRFKKYLAEKEIELSLIKDESIVVGKRVKLLSEIKIFTENNDSKLLLKKNRLYEFNNFLKTSNKIQNKKEIKNPKNQIPNNKENRLKQFDDYLENIKKKLH